MAVEKYWCIAEMNISGCVHAFLSHKKMTKEEIQGLREKYKAYDTNIDVPEFGVSYDRRFFCGIITTNCSRADAEKICREANKNHSLASAFWEHLNRKDDEYYETDFGLDEEE